MNRKSVRQAVRRWETGGKGRTRGRLSFLAMPMPRELATGLLISLTAVPSLACICFVANGTVSLSFGLPFILAFFGITVAAVLWAHQRADRVSARAWQVVAPPDRPEDVLITMAERPRERHD